MKTTWQEWVAAALIVLAVIYLSAAAHDDYAKHKASSESDSAMRNR